MSRSRSVVTRLAEPAAEQLRYLREAGIVPAGTEAKFADLNELLDRMSDAGGEVWTEAALGADPRWDQVRRSARDALVGLTRQETLGAPLRVRPAR